MGYYKPINIAEVLSQIRMASYECRDMRTDGYTAWGLKQDLYQVKWAIDDALRQCPAFAPEEEWIREQEKNRVVKILKEK